MKNAPDKIIAMEMHSILEYADGLFDMIKDHTDADVAKELLNARAQELGTWMMEKIYEEKE